VARGRGGIEPRTFFLNEQHEPARGVKEGGGGTARYAPIDWPAKAQRLNYTLQATARKIQRSSDPLRDSRYYLVTLPQQEVEKQTAQTNRYPTGTKAEETDYGREHSMVFRRLGLDLIDVSPSGKAVVHATRERLTRLLESTKTLASEGPKLRSRFMTIESFDVVPSSMRADTQWIRSLPSGGLIDTVVELQPLLGRAEFDQVMGAMVALFGTKGEGFTRSGTDFSGRHWLRGRLGRKSIEAIVKDFSSVQSVHGPLRCELLGKTGRASVSVGRVTAPLPAPEPLPTVAVVDSGVPAEHAHLAPYRRGTGYVDQDAGARWFGDHGSLVASRVVFGDVDPKGKALDTPGRCAFYDVMVAMDQDGRINDKGILNALSAVVSTAPDVRVFNFSFGDRPPLGALGEVERREWSSLVQDIDNFIFARDVVVVIAAGNSPPGVVPSLDYPGHADEPAWALAVLPSGYNTLTCGSAVERLDPDALVQNIGWPSPFTRIGPGFPGECDAPIPEFAAHGGNSDERFHCRSSLGVWGLNAEGQLEDHSGTSFSAPLLSREVALAFAELQRACAPATRVYAATVKAFLALTAQAYPTPSRVRKLSERTLGLGRASADRLTQPSPASAVFVWQGLLEGPDDILRVTLPIPREWLAEAELPKLRVACSWDSPVNAAVRSRWGCRKVTVKVRAGGVGDALTGSRAKHPIHPLWVRQFDLDAEKLASQKITALPETWVLELSYEQVADYLSSMEFSPKQRVGLALELQDEGETARSPQAAVQALPIAPSMVRLSQSAVPIQTPVKIRGR